MTSQKTFSSRKLFRGRLFTLIALLALLLAACGGGDTPATDSGSDSGESTTSSDESSSSSSDSTEDSGDADEAMEEEEEMAADDGGMSELTEIRFGNFNPNFQANILPELSDEFGYLQEGGIEGIEVTFADQSTLFPALIGDGLDIILQDTDAVAGAFAAGEEGFIIVSIYRDKEPWELAFRDGIDINNLEGVTCSGGGAGGRNEFNAKEMVVRLGGNPDDIEWIPIGGGSDARVNAFAEGQIDCVQHFDRHRQLVIDAGGTTIYDELENVPQDGFIVRRDFAEENPRAVINFLKATIKARAFYKDLGNKDEVISVMRDRGYDIPDTFVAQYDRGHAIIADSGHFEISAMEQLIADSVRTGSLTEEVDWRNIVDMSYINQAYAELGMDDLVRDYSGEGHSGDDMGSDDMMPMIEGEPSEISELRFGNFNPNYAANLLPELSAEFGYLADGGFDDIEVTFADQSTLFPALIGGGLDVVLQDTDAVAGAYVAGEQGFIIVSIYRDKEPWELAFRDGIDINNLEGVTCSGGGAGGRNEFNAKEMVARLGGNPDDIEWIPIGGGSDARVNAFAEGQIDCVQHFDRHRQLVIDAGGTTIYDELENVPQDGFIVRRDFAEENPRAVINFLKATILSRAYYKDLGNKDDVISIMQSRGYDIPDTFVAQYDRGHAIIADTGHFDIGAMEQLIVDSVRTGSLTEEVDWRNIVDMSYLNQAYAELGMDDLVRDYTAMPAEESMDDEEMMLVIDGEPSEISEIRFGNFNPNYAANLLPELSAEFGYLADGGFDSIEVTFADQSTLFPALIGGGLDIVLQDTDAVAGAYVAGEQGFIIVSIYRDKEPWELALRNDIDINDLSGITCSGGGAGGRNEFNAKEMVARLGGNPDDIEWIPIGGGSDARVNAFVEGQIDCVQHFDRHRELVIGADGTTVYDELENVPQDGFIVRRDFAEENPRAVINFLKATIISRSFFKDLANKDEVISIMQSRGYDIPETFVAQYDRGHAIIADSGHFDIGAMEQLIVDSVRTGSLSEEVDWRNIVDMSYLNQAYAELGLDDLVRDYE